jgi:hypothetical protein
MINKFILVYFRVEIFFGTLVSTELAGSAQNAKTEPLGSTLTLKISLYLYCPLKFPLNDS